MYEANNAFGCRRSVSIYDLAKLTQREFKVHNFSAMGRIVLKTLQCRVNTPTAKAFDRIHG